MINNPLVSIVIPVFNGANYLAGAIESALAQTYRNIEILVVNDGSGDDGATREAALRFGNRIRYFEKENGGVASALNLALAEMKGEWFSWLSHDDLFLPEKTRIQVDYVNRVECDIVYGDFEFIDADGKLLDRKSGTADSAAKGNFFYQLLSGYPVNGCTTLIRRTLFDKTGNFNTDLRTTQDYDFWFRCARVTEFNLLNEVLLQSRIHEAQDTNRWPLRQYECDELYTRISRYIVQDKTHKKMSQKQILASGKFLLQNNFLSAFFMIQRALGSGLRNRLLIHAFRKLSVQWLSGK